MLTPRTVRRGSSLALVGIFAAAAAACGGAPDSPSLDDGISSVMQSTTSAPGKTAAPAGDAGVPEMALDCTVAAEGCPCDHDGDTVTCAGPKVTTGNYTTCAPGKRQCDNGTWGACVGNTLYSASATMTQDYASPCHSGQTVHWGAIDLQGRTPSGATIDVLVQGANTEAQLDAAPMVHITQFSGAANASWTSPDVTAAMTQAGVAASPWLRITLSLTSSESAPAQVTAWHQATSCESSH